MLKWIVDLRSQDVASINEGCPSEAGFPSASELQSTELVFPKESLNYQQIPLELLLLINLSFLSELRLVWYILNWQVGVQCTRMSKSIVLPPQYISGGSTWSGSRTSAFASYRRTGHTQYLFCLLRGANLERWLVELFAKILDTSMKHVELVSREAWGVRRACEERKTFRRLSPYYLRDVSNFLAEIAVALARRKLVPKKVKPLFLMYWALALSKRTRVRHKWQADIERGSF